MRADQDQEQMLMLSNFALLPLLTCFEHSCANKFKITYARNATKQKFGKSFVRYQERSRLAPAKMTEWQESNLQTSIRNFYPLITWPDYFWLWHHVARFVSNLDSATRDPTSLRTYDLCEGERASTKLCFSRFPHPLRTPDGTASIRSNCVVMEPPPSLFWRSPCCTVFYISLIICWPCLCKDNDFFFFKGHNSQFLAALKVHILQLHRDDSAWLSHCLSEWHTKVMTDLYGRAGQHWDKAHADRADCHCWGPGII